MNPYQVLRVPPDATDEVIRAAYLIAIKRCPPERDPRQFERLAAAYERIKDEESRLNMILDPPEPEASTPVAVLLESARENPFPRDMDTLKKFLRSFA